MGSDFPKDRDSSEQKTQSLAPSAPEPATELDKSESNPVAPPTPGLLLNLGEDPSIRVSAEEPGRYTIKSVHGSGGQAKVLLAVDAYIGREVAIKELLPAGETGGSQPGSGSGRTTLAESRFLREARVTGQLEHPNIVPVYELGRHRNGQLYYTMRLVRGKTLSDALKECPTLQDRIKLLPHFVDLCNAMAYAHSRGVIHRDLKPGNVMVGEFGETMVLDWGLAKVKHLPDLRGSDFERQLRLLHAATDGQTVDGVALGTPSYMSPEQAKGLTQEINERSDVWGLGAVLYRMLTGQPPFEGLDSASIIDQVATQSVKPVRLLCPEAPPELTAVAEKALQRDPMKRYANAGEVAAEARAFLTGGRVRAYAYSSWELVRRFASRYKLVLSVAAAALTIIVALTVLSHFQLVAQRDRAQAQRNEAMKLANLLVNDLFDNVEKLAGSTPTLDKLLSATLAYYQTHVDPTAGETAERIALAAAYRKVGDLAFSRARTDEAQTAIRRSLGLLDSLAAADPGNLDVQGELARSCGSLGYLFTWIGNRSEARSVLERGLAAAERFAASDAAKPARQRPLMSLLSNLGDLVLQEGKFDEARKYLERRREVASRLLTADPADPDRLDDMVHSLEQLAKTADKQEKNTEAREFVRQALELAEKLVARSPGNAKAQGMLASALSWMASEEETFGNPEEARKLLERAKDIAQALAEADPESADKQQKLAGYLGDVGDNLNLLSRSEEALAAFQRSVAILEKLTAADPAEVSKQGALALAYSRLSDLTRSRGKLKEGKDLWVKALAIEERLAKLDPNFVGRQTELATYIGTMGDILEEGGDLAAAREYRQRELGITEEVLKQDPDYVPAISRRSMALYRLGLLALSTGKLDEAKRYLDQDFELSREGELQAPNSKTKQQDLAASYMSTGDVALVRGDLAGAQSRYQEAYRRMKRLADEDPENNNKQWVLGDTLLRLGQLGKYQEIVLRLHKQDPQDVDMEGTVVSSSLVAGKYRTAIQAGPAAVKANQENTPMQVLLLADLAMAELLDGDRQKAGQYAIQAADLLHQRPVPLAVSNWFVPADRAALETLRHPQAHHVLALMRALEAWNLGAAPAKAEEALRRFAREIAGHR